MLVEGGAVLCERLLHIPNLAMADVTLQHVESLLSVFDPSLKVLHMLMQLSEIERGRFF